MLVWANVESLGALWNEGRGHYSCVNDACFVACLNEVGAYVVLTDYSFFAIGFVVAVFEV